MTGFFDRVVAATRLSPMLAPFVVRRICVNQGISATELGPAELQRILPKLAEAIERYLEPARVGEMREALDRLAASAPDSTEKASA